MPIPLIGAQGIARTTFQSAQITQNLYPEISEGKDKAVLYRIPGIKTAFLMGSNQCRSNGVTFNGVGYFVAGDGLYSVTTGLVVTKEGTLGTSAGRVSIVAGFSYIMLVDGVKGYTWDGTTFAQITDVDFPSEQIPALGVSHCAYKDGFFLVVADNTGEFYKSALEDPTSWNGLEYENAEARPDILISIHSTDDFLYLFGLDSLEVWYNSGASNFPFSRAQGGVSSWGIDAPFSVAEGDNSVFFLGKTDDGGAEVCQTVGVSVKVISTSEISNEINNSTTSDAFSFIYMQKGHQFYVLTFPISKKTFVYDISTQLWHSRHSQTILRWRPNGHLFFNNKHYVGDSLTGQFYELDLDTYTDDGDYIEWIRRTAPTDKDYQAIVFDEIVLDAAGGIGATRIYTPVYATSTSTTILNDTSGVDFTTLGFIEGTDWIRNVTTGESVEAEYIVTIAATAITYALAASCTFNSSDEYELVRGGVNEIFYPPTTNQAEYNPQVTYRYSDDGGHTWSSPIDASLGKKGEYRTKAHWYQLGDSYERVHEFSSTASNFTALLAAYAQVRLSEF